MCHERHASKNRSFQARTPDLSDDCLVLRFVGWTYRCPGISGSTKARSSWREDLVPCWPPTGLGSLLCGVAVGLSCGNSRRRLLRWGGFFLYGARHPGRVRQHWMAAVAYVPFSRAAALSLSLLCMASAIRRKNEQECVFVGGCGGCGDWACGSMFGHAICGISDRIKIRIGTSVHAGYYQGL